MAETKFKGHKGSFKRIKTEQQLYLLPVATFLTEFGYKAQITVEHNCYVLYLQQEDGSYKPTAYWFKEAVQALRELPEEPNDAHQFI